MMRLGIGTWAYPWSIGIPGYPQPQKPLTAWELLHRAHDFGLHLVQICDNLPYYEMSEEELSDIQGLADNLEIEIGLGTRGVQSEHLDKILEYAGLLRAKTLRTVIDMPDPGLVTDELKTVMPKFAAANVTLVLENTEILDANEIASIVRSVDSPYLGICLDTVNSLGRLQTLDQVVAALGPYARMVHYKDFSVQRVSQSPPVVRMGLQIVGQAAGDGRLDAKWLLNAVTQNGNDPDVILEMWPPFLDTIEKTVQNETDWVERGIHFLKGVMLEGMYV